jgi:predicted protein tyrosine phosphatase
MIYVCSLREMPTHVRSLRPHRLISLVRPEEQPATPPGLPAERHLRINLDDVCAPCADAIIPCAAHIGELLEKLEDWTGETPILVHCVAGVSRSMAAALIAAASRAPARELELALRLRRAAPHAQPNRLMIELGDSILGCDGRLVAALAAMGAAMPVEQAPLVRFPFAAGPAAPPSRADASPVR